MSNKILETYEELYSHFGPQGWWPLYNHKTGRIEYRKGDYRSPRNEHQRFEISVGAILTQNTSWKNVEKAILNLYRNNLISKEAIEKIDIKKLAEIIKSSGYHNQKARKLKEFVKFLNSNLPMTRENLLQVWGIGPETADSVLLYAYNKPIFVIDAYTKRIMERLGFNEKSYGEIQDIFMKNLPKDCKLFNEYHALLVELGKNICRKEPYCKECFLCKI